MRARWPEKIKGGNASQMCLLNSLNKKNKEEKTLTAKDKQAATMCELEYNYRESIKGKEKIFKACIRMF